tara:strand:+ start:414 stop:626 length:213 start_codon:yes stop_codon:yes gene_type:complete
MDTLDLHGVKHRDVEYLVDIFIRKNHNNLPVEIITGNSLDMQAEVKKVITNYGLKMNPKSYFNLGSYIIK